MVKVSIIVPIFNVEKYLSRCIESIQKQTLRDLQIILVNDGSQDSSLSICKEYQKRDDRIEIINKSNGGVSSARNAGINAAIGDYIGFIDPDDWIEHDMYESMYLQVKKTNADVCMCNFSEETMGKSKSNLLNIEKDFLIGMDILNIIISKMIGGSSLNSQTTTIMGSVWRLLIKKEVMVQNNIRFVPGIPLMEDLIFCVELLLKSEKVSINNSVFYHYFQNSTSAVTVYRNDMIEVQQMVFHRLEEILKEKKVYPIVETRLKVRYVNLIIGIIANEVHRQNTKNIFGKIAFIKKLCKDSMLKNILYEIDTKGYTIRKKIVLKAIQNESGIFLFLYYSILQYLEKLK